MTEYDVKKALTQRSGQLNKDAAASGVNGIPNSVLTDVFAGKRQATSDMMGRRADLAPSIAAKMSQAFGMDVSGVQLYRSDAMAGTGMHGMAQGNKVVLGSDVDLNTMEGQATLGHELSHIRAQSMGVGSGRGLLSDASLEHQADTEGMLAARGMSIGGESMGMSMGLGMAGMEGLSPIGSGLSATAAAPMQANKDSYMANPKKNPVAKGLLGTGMVMRKGLAGALAVLSAPARLMGGLLTMAAMPLTMASQAYDRKVRYSEEGTAGAHVGNFFKGLGGGILDTLSTVANIPGAIFGALGNKGLESAKTLYNLGEGKDTSDVEDKVNVIQKTGSSTPDMKQMFGFDSGKRGFDQFIKKMPSMGQYFMQRNFNDGSGETSFDDITNQINSGSVVDPNTRQKSPFLYNKLFSGLSNAGNRKQRLGLLTPLNWIGKLLFGRRFTKYDKVFGKKAGEATLRGERETSDMQAGLGDAFDVGDESEIIYNLKKEGFGV